MSNCAMSHSFLPCGIEHKYVYISKTSLFSTVLIFKVLYGNAQTGKKKTHTFDTRKAGYGNASS